MRNAHLTGARLLACHAFHPWPTARPSHPGRSQSPPWDDAAATDSGPRSLQTCGRPGEGPAWTRHREGFSREWMWREQLMNVRHGALHLLWSAAEPGHWHSREAAANSKVAWRSVCGETIQSGATCCRMGGAQEKGGAMTHVCGEHHGWATKNGRGNGFCGGRFLSLELGALRHAWSLSCGVNQHG